MNAYKNPAANITLPPSMLKKKRKKKKFTVFGNPSLKV